MLLPKVRSISFGVLTILLCCFERTHAQSVKLAWDPVPDADGYRLHSGTSSAVYTQTTDTGNVTSVLVSNLVWEKTYFFAVTAYSSSGQSALSNQVAYTPVPAPVLLSAVQSGSNSVKLTWSESDTNSGTFKVLYGTSSGNYPNSLNVAGSPAIVTGLSQGKTYYFVVRFLDNTAANPSPISNQLSCPISQASPTPSPTLSPVPTAPSNLKAAVVSSSQITLAWIDNSTNESGFKIERSLDGTNFSQVTFVAANTTTYASTGLTASTKYYYRVEAYNSGGNSSYSNTASATTAP